MKQNLSESIMANLKENDDKKFRYSLLSRLESDCKYFLGNGNRNERHLWAGNVEKQIAKMRELYNSFAEDEKPEWLTLEQINDYERRMLSNEDNGKEYHIKNPTVIEDINKIHEDEKLNNKIRGNSMKVRESIMKNLKEEKAYPRVSPEFETYEKTYSSITNDDAVDTLDELIRYFSDFSAAVKEDSFKYQGANAKELDKVVSLLTEAKTTLDNMWENT